MAAPVIISHPRSGTHLLAWMLWYYIFSEAADRRPRVGGRVGHYTRRKLKPSARYTHPDGRITQESATLVMPYRSLIGGHTATPPKRPYIYVVRSTQAVLRSWYRFREFHNPTHDDDTFEDFLAAPVDIAGSPSVPGFAPNPTAHHNHHMRAHRSAATLVVDFDVLLAEPQATLQQIAECFGRTPPMQAAPPPARIGWASGAPRSI